MNFAATSCQYWLVCESLVCFPNKIISYAPLGITKKPTRLDGAKILENEPE